MSKITTAYFRAKHLVLVRQLIKNRSQALFSIIAGLLVIGAVQYAVGWDKLLIPWREAEFSSLSLAVLFMFASYILRALRVYDYFHPLPDNGFDRCLKLTLLHNLFNNLLPLRAGEASFPWLLRQYFALPFPRTLSALIWFRVLDLHVVAGAALLIVTSHILPPIACVVLPGLWMLALWWIFLRLQQLAPNPLILRLNTRSQHWLKQAQAGLPRTAAAFWRAWLWTILNWLVKLAAFAVILQALAKLPLLAAIAGALGGELTSILPIHGVAGLGTYEAGVLAGLLPFSIAPADAIGAAVNLHLFLLGSCVLGGALALLLRGGHDGE